MSTCFFSRILFIHSKNDCIIFLKKSIDRKLSDQTYLALNRSRARCADSRFFCFLRSRISSTSCGDLFNPILLKCEILSLFLVFKGRFQNVRCRFASRILFLPLDLPFFDVFTFACWGQLWSLVRTARFHSRSSADSAARRARAPMRSFARRHAAARFLELGVTTFNF